jgi:hypothetical protein
MRKDSRVGVRWLIWAGVSGVLVGCATSAAQAPLSGSASAATPPAISGEFAEQGTFVDHGVPKAVVLWLRVPAPGRDIPLLATLLGFSSLPDPSEVLAQKLGALGRSVDLSRPLDWTFGFEDQPGASVLAASVVNLNTFLAQTRGDFRITHKSRGRWRIEPKAKPAEGVWECELWHAAPPVGARLVCGSDALAIEEQGGFLLAAARISVDRANVHAEVPGSAALLALQKQETTDKLAAPAAGKDDAAEALGRRWVTDLVRDLGGISWDLTLRQASVDISQVLRFSRADSMLSASLSGRDGEPKPVPEAFWRLPNDSDVAFYSEGAEPERMRRTGATWLHDLLGVIIAESKYSYPSAVVDGWERALRGTLLRGGAFEIAHGGDLDRAARALQDAADHASDRAGSADPVLKKARAQLGGWTLLGIADDSQAYLQALREVLRVATDGDKYPLKKGATPPTAEQSTHYLSERPLQASSGLPREALHIVLRSEPNPKYRASKGKEPVPSASTYHVIAVADSAQHLWLAISTDEAQAVARLRAVLAPDPAKTLGASDELRQFAKQRIVGLGFGTLAGLSGLSVSADSKLEVLESQQKLKGIRVLPKAGRTRMPIWVTRTPLGNGERRIAVNLRLTPDALGDLVQTFFLGDDDSEGE